MTKAARPLRKREPISNLATRLGGGFRRRRAAWGAFVSVLLLLAAPACAQSNTAAQASAPARIHPALFVARDADSTIYLFGTVHVRPQGSPWGGPEAETALAASSDVWTEIEVSPAADAQAQTLVVQLGFAPADHPLSSWLAPAQEQRLNTLAARFGLSAAALDRMQPWLAAIALSMAPMQQAGFDPQSGVDRAVSADAQAHGKHMRAFETVDQQLHFVANLSPDAQRQMLLDAIDEADHGPDELLQLSHAWERGDLNRIERLVVADTEQKYPELYDVLFRRRNAAWVDTITHEMQGSGTEFIAVGAAHMVGHDGLVAQLRAHGIRVDRVPASN